MLSNSRSAQFHETILDIIRNYNGRIVSILTSYEKAPKDYRNVYIRAYQIDRTQLGQLRIELEKKSTVLYIVDHREELRKIFIPETNVKLP